MDRSIQDNSGVIATLLVLVVISAFTLSVGMAVFPRVAESLGADVRVSPMMISSYLLGYALGQLPLGLFADRYGRLPTVYFGLSVFILAGIATTLVANIWLLFFVRVLQGFGGAVGPVLSRTIARDVSDGRRTVQVMSLLATALAVSTILAPVVGSSIAAAWDWRVTFATSPVLGLLVLLMSIRFLSETKPAGNGYESIRTQIVNSWRAFIGNSSSLWGTTLVSLSFAGYMAFLASAAPVLEKVYHQPIVAIGPLYASTIVPYVAGVWLARHLVASRSPADVVRIGALIFALVGSALAPLSFIGAAPLVLLWGVICVYMFGLGLIFPNATAIVMQPVPDTAGFVSSILGVFQVGTAAIVSGLVVFLFDGSIRALAAMLCIAALSCAAVVFLRRD